MPSSKTFPIIIAIIALVVFPVLLSTIWFLGKSTQQDIEETIINQFGEQQLIIAESTAKILETEIVNVQEKLSMIAQIPEVRSGDTTACSEKLKEISESMHVKLGNLGRMNKDGLFYCGVVDSIIGVDGTKYDYLRRIISDPARKPVLSRGIMFEYTDRTEHLVALHVPVFDVNGIFSGTLGGAIYVDALKETYLKDIVFGERGQVILLDDDGHILYHPNADFIHRNINDEYMQAILTKSPEFQNLVKEAQSGLTGIKKYIHGGEQVIAASKIVSLRLIGDRHWAVIITAPAAEIKGFIAPLVSQLQFQIFILIGVLGFLALGMIALLIQWNRTLNQQVRERTRELIEAKNKSEVLLASIGDGVFAIDRESNIIHFNKQAEEISGYKSSEVLGKPYYDFLRFVKVKDKGENIAFIREALKGKIAAMGDHTVLVRKDKRELPVEDSAAPIKDETGKVLGAIVVFRDATEERQIERMREELISLVGHQLKTPLVAMEGFVGMLKEGKLGAKEKQYTEEIERSVKAMIELIGGVLNISRIEQGRIELKPQPIQIEEVINGLIKDFLPLAEKRHVNLELKKPPRPLPELNVDPKYLREAIQNIVSNAINYTKDKVIISFERVDDHLHFVCADNGIGVPQEEQSKIFTKFYRASNVAKTGIEGTGLGLSITKAIIERSGGRVWFESKEGKGTTFYVTLPFI